MAEPTAWDSIMSRFNRQSGEGLASSSVNKVTSPDRAVSYNFNKGSGTYTPTWSAPSTAGGTGTYAYISDTSGNLVGMDKAAANAYTSQGGTGLIDGSIANDLALGKPDAGTDWLGIGGLALKGLGAFTDWQQLGLAKDTLAFNKMNANRNYEAERTKYNNAYDRTDAVNKVYGSQTVGTKI